MCTSRSPSTSLAAASASCACRPAWLACAACTPGRIGWGTPSPGVWKAPAATAPGWPACWPTAATRCWKSAALTAACAATAASPTRSTPKAAARAVLAGTALGQPKQASGVAASLRQLRAARQAAVKARTQATNQLRALLLDAPEPLRALRAQPNSAHLAAQLARLRPATTTAPADLLKHTLRSIARRWLALDQEVSDLDQLIGPLVRTTAPRLLARPGVGPDAAATLLIAAGDNPDRLHSEASFAALCGVSPLPASSGKTRRHRLNRGGDCQANRALHMVVHSGMQHDPRTRAYVQRRTKQGLSRREIMRCLIGRVSGARPAVESGRDCSVSVRGRPRCLAARRPV
jgi:transposase